jgi:hypothetical protein
VAEAAVEAVAAACCRNAPRVVAAAAAVDCMPTLAM